jgi:hypothetical protein
MSHTLLWLLPRSLSFRCPLRELTLLWSAVATLRTFLSLSLTYSRRQVCSPHRMIILGAVSLFLYGASASESIRDDDLSTFVTVSAGPHAGLVIRCSRIGQLPNHRAIKWNITYHDRSSVAPGYWFVAPYFAAESEPATTRWIPSQIGPHIFDQDGVCKVIHSRLSDFY